MIYSFVRCLKTELVSGIKCQNGSWGEKEKVSLEPGKEEMGILSVSYLSLSRAHQCIQFIANQ